MATPTGEHRSTTSSRDGVTHKPRGVLARAPRGSAGGVTRLPRRQWSGRRSRAARRRRAHRTDIAHHADPAAGFLWVSSLRADYHQYSLAKAPESSRSRQAAPGQERQGSSLGQTRSGHNRLFEAEAYTSRKRPLRADRVGTMTLAPGVDSPTAWCRLPCGLALTLPAPGVRLVSTNPARGVDSAAAA
jgi:hypothetical protein